MAKGMQKNYTLSCIATNALARFHMATPRFREKPFYVKLTAFSTA